MFLLGQVGRGVKWECKSMSRMTVDEQAFAISRVCIRKQLEQRHEDVRVHHVTGNCT